MTGPEISFCTFHGQKNCSQGYQEVTPIDI